MAISGHRGFDRGKPRALGAGALGGPLQDVLGASPQVCEVELMESPLRPSGASPKLVGVWTAPIRTPSAAAAPRRSEVEWHQGELYPRVGFIVTNLTRPAERITKFYNGRGTAEQYIKEGKLALRWTRLSCHAFRHNAVRLQLFALAYNLAKFLRSLALPKEVEHWSLTTLREKLVKIGARIVRHGRYVVFQLAEVAVPRSPPRSCAASTGPHMLNR
jgi:Transposase DDE domain group 1